MKNIISNIKVCAFDAYGTCFDINSAAAIIKNKIGKKWLDFSHTWRTIQLEYTWLRSLMKNHKNFWQVTKDSLNFAMKAHNIDPKYRQELLKLYQELDAYSDLTETLLYLKRKKIKTCILSNGTPKLLNLLTKKANVQKLFDSIISVEKIKIYKPSPKVYQLVTQKYKCNPNQVCFFSSNSWDIVGAKSFGFKSVWVNRINKNFDNLDHKPNKIIKNLLQIKKFL
jgi:2-haloacid dehalogenase